MKELSTRYRNSQHFNNSSHKSKCSQSAFVSLIFCLKKWLPRHLFFEGITRWPWQLSISKLVKRCYQVSCSNHSPAQLMNSKAIFWYSQNKQSNIEFIYHWQNTRNLHKNSKINSKSTKKNPIKIYFRDFLSILRFLSMVDEVTIRKIQLILCSIAQDRGLVLLEKNLLVAIIKSHNTTLHPNSLLQE